jgi:hypothetical protein
MKFDFVPFIARRKRVLGVQNREDVEYFKYILGHWYYA